MAHGLRLSCGLPSCSEYKALAAPQPAVVSVCGSRSVGATVATTKKCSSIKALVNQDKSYDPERELDVLSLAMRGSPVQLDCVACRRRLKVHFKDGCIPAGELERVRRISFGITDARIRERDLEKSARVPTFLSI